MNIDNNRIMNSDERFVATTREYAAVLLDVTNHFIELEKHFKNLTWGVEAHARNSGLSSNRWNSLHVFLEVSGDHEHTYRQINFDSYCNKYDGYAICAKVEDFIDSFVKEFQERL